MRTEVLDNLTRHIKGESEVGEAVQINGGFTGAEKFVIKAEPTDIFLKVADLRLRPDEAIALDTEAMMYEVIVQLPSVQKYFPKLVDYKRDDETAALFIEYLPEVSWGGPWNEQTIAMLSDALDEIHASQVPPELAEEVAHNATRLQAKLREQSPYTFDQATRLEHFTSRINRDTNEFVNSRGLTYFEATDKEIDDLLWFAHEFDPKSEQSLVLWDMTYGNLGFTDEQAYLVDPVYVDIGVPASDRARAGINILRILEEQSASQELVQLVDEVFLIDKKAVAYEIAYFMACSALEYQRQESYMDFQQSCAVAGLNAWRRLTPA